MFRSTCLYHWSCVKQVKKSVNVCIRQNVHMQRNGQFLTCFQTGSTSSKELNGQGIARRLPLRALELKAS
jgi:hypothetical protein